MIVKRNALIDELAAVPENGKAEIIGGKVVRMSPTGGRPGRASGAIFASLMQHEQTIGGGYASPDNVGFIVDLPDRGSFSPDAAWYTGPVVDMGFVHGAPAFAVEVRSESDYGPARERAIAQKIGIISRRGRWWCGMWICSAPLSSGSSPRINRRRRLGSAMATPPMQNRRYRIGCSR